MTTYEPNQRVHVSFTAEIAAPEEPYYYAVPVPGDCGLLHLKNLTDVSVEAAEPDNWPPQVGDIWRVKGHEYYVRRNRGPSRGLVIEAFENSSVKYWEKPGGYGLSVGGSFKCLNPVLVRRAKSKDES